MPFPPPYFYVRDDEEVLLREGPGGGFAWVMFVVPLVLATLALVALFVAHRVVGPFPEEVFVGAYVAYAVFVAAAAVVAWRVWATTEYVITDARIYARIGRLRTRVHFTTHDKVTDVHYHRGVLDRVFGVSHATFATAGGDVAVRGVRDALAVKEVAEEARDAFIAHLLEDVRVAPAVAAPTKSEPDAAEAGEEAPPLPPPAPWTGPVPDYLRKGEVPIWYGKPRLRASLVAAAPVVPLAFFLSLGGPPGVLPFVVLLAAFPLMGFRALQLTRMEYVVTPWRVYARSGVLSTTVRQLTYDKITDVTYRQDILGRLLSYAGLTVNTAGSNEAPIVMVGLADPLGVKEVLEAARARATGEEVGA